MNEQQIFILLLVQICTYTFWKGGAPERISAAALLFATSATVLVTWNETHRFIHVETAVIGTDIGLFGLLVWIALRSTRWWPLFLAGFQFDALFVHMMRTVAPDTIQLAYLYGTALWSYPMILLLALGTWRHQRRLKRWGEDFPWRPSEQSSHALDSEEAVSSVDERSAARDRQ